MLVENCFTVLKMSVEKAPMSENSQYCGSSFIFSWIKLFSCMSSVFLPTEHVLWCVVGLTVFWSFGAWGHFEVIRSSELAFGYHQCIYVFQPRDIGWSLVKDQQCRISPQKLHLDRAKPAGRQTSSSKQKGLLVITMIITMQKKTKLPAGAKTQVQYSQSGKAAHWVAQPSQSLHDDCSICMFKKLLAELAKP